VGLCKKWEFFRGFLWTARGEFVVKTWWFDGGKSAAEKYANF
jgi:hypothetical protein